MHVGYGAVFQNPNDRLTDREVWRQEIRLAEMAEPLGFDSVWAIEHHFDDYTTRICIGLCPLSTRLDAYYSSRIFGCKIEADAYRRRENGNRAGETGQGEDARRRLR